MFMINKSTFDVTNVPLEHESSNEIIVHATKLIQFSLKPLRSHA